MVTVHDPLGPPLLRTPVVDVTKAGDAYTVKTFPANEVWYLVEVAAGINLVQLPNGRAYSAGQKALLTPVEYAQISDGAFSGNTPLIDSGIVTDIFANLADASLKLTAPIDLTEQATLAAISASDAVGVSILGQDGVVWSSANPAIATVSKTGLVTAVSAGGPINITATWGQFADDVAVTVVA